MSLTIEKNGDLRLSAKRGALCLEAVCELEQLAYLLPTLPGAGGLDELRAGFVVRGVAARILSLSEVLGAALNDEVVTTEKLERKVMVLQFEGDV